MAVIGAGSKLQVSISSSLTDVAEVVSINGPQITFTDVDITNLQSANVFKEFMAGFGDGGTVVLDCNFTAAQMTTLYGMVRVTQVWRVLFSNASKWDFSGYINAISTDIPLDEEINMPISIKVTGKPTYTA